MFSQNVIIGNRSYEISSDDEYLRAIGSHFEPQMSSLFERLVQKTYRVLDIGANIGCTALLFAELAERVDAFEPSPSTFEFLQTNVKNSGHSNIDVHNYGLGSQNEDLTISFAPDNRSGAFVSNKLQASDGHSIEKIVIRKGDDVISDDPVGFIKIDVEGFEKDVIVGLKGIISRDEPIVVLELNHWCLNAFQRICVPDFFDFLLDVFPILYAVDDQKWVDLRDSSSRYTVMYEHINHLKFPNLVGAFRSSQIENTDC